MNSFLLLDHFFSFHKSKSLLETLVIRHLNLMEYVNVETGIPSNWLQIYYFEKIMV